ASDGVAVLHEFGVAGVEARREVSYKLLNCSRKLLRRSDLFRPKLYACDVWKILYQHCGTARGDSLFRAALACHPRRGTAIDGRDFPGRQILPQSCTRLNATKRSSQEVDRLDDLAESNVRPRQGSPNNYRHLPSHRLRNLSTAGTPHLVSDS